MTRYIDADEYCDELLKMVSDISFYNQEINGIRNAIARLQAQQDANVQPVVHCNECQWHDGEGDQMYCLNDFWNFNFTPNVYDSDFCSKGDKLDGDEHDNG